VSEPRILLSAGETSGDLHGAELAKELRELYPDAEMFGLAGPRMAAVGVRPIVDFGRLPVTGLVEVLPRLPFFLGLRRQLRRILDSDPPDLVIPIDYPGFNLWLARQARIRGIRVLVYIAPQVWAWRRSRTRALAEDADRVAVVFPQEETFLQENGVEARFVGHPLVDRLTEWPEREEARSRLGIVDEPVLGLLPGSRVQELRRHLSPFLRVARAVSRRHPGLRVLVARAPDVPAELYRRGPDFQLVEDSRTVLRASDAVLTKAGTSTVEAALAGTPLVVAHRVNPMTYLIGRWLVEVESITMVNLLAGERVVPEYVQRLPIESIAGDVSELLKPASERREAMLRALAGVRERLGEPGAARRTANLAREALEAGD
jgi:lipid-A-disaccharide synthase